LLELLAGAVFTAVAAIGIVWDGIAWVGLPAELGSGRGGGGGGTRGAWGGVDGRCASVITTNPAKRSKTICSKLAQNRIVAIRSTNQKRSNKSVHFLVQVLVGKISYPRRTRRTKCLLYKTLNLFTGRSQDEWT